MVETIKSKRHRCLLLFMVSTMPQVGDCCSGVRPFARRQVPPHDIRRGNKPYRIQPTASEFLIPRIHAGEREPTSDDRGTIGCILR